MRRWFAVKVSADTPSFMADAWRLDPADMDGDAAAAAAERAFAMAKGSAAGLVVAAVLQLASAENTEGVLAAVEAMPRRRRSSVHAPAPAGFMEEGSFPEHRPGVN
jgi:hypothetical protein